MIKITSLHSASTEAMGWADQVISLLDPGMKAPKFNAPIEHLVLNFDDVDDDAQEGDVAPTIDHVRTALDFAKNDTRILIHCFAGICRSTAMALGIMLKRGMSIKDSYEHLVSIRPQAWPNFLVVRHIDNHLRLENELINFNKNWRIKVSASLYL